MSDFKITNKDDAANSVPRALRVAAAVSWRVLVVLGALYVIGFVFGRLSAVMIPVAIALLLAALLAPAVAALASLGVPRSLSTLVVLVSGLAAVGGVLTFVINNFIEGFPNMQRQILASFERMRRWLAESPLQIREEQISDYIDEAEKWFQNNQATLTSGALSTAGTFGTFLTGLFLALFTLIFFLYDGRGVWLYTIKLLPAHVRSRVDLAGIRGFDSLVGYVRATTLVAVVDAVGIWLGLVIMGVPQAVPLAALVFLGAFIPIVGAVASGAVAVLVALVTKGAVAALVILIVVLAVQQLEGHVLQPLLLGRAVKLHPLAVVLAISAGMIVAGIPGALLAVPLVAVLNSAVRSLVSNEEDSDTEGSESETGTEELPQSEAEKAPDDEHPNAGR